MIRSAFRLSLVALVAFLVVAASVRPAAAHAVLLSTDPGDSAVLDQAPAEIVLHFNEPVTPVVVRIISQATGQPVTEPGDVHAIDQDLKIALPAGLADGGYLVSYRVVSVDSHPVAGAFPFGIGVTPAAPPPQSGGAHRVLWQTASLVFRIVHDFGVLVSAGGTFFLLLVGAPAACAQSIRRRLAVAAIGTILVTAIGVGIEGGLLADASAGAIANPELWRLGWMTSLGTSAVFSVLGLGLVAGGLMLPLGIARLPIASVGALLAIVGFAVTGHAATADPVTLTAPMMALHTGAIAYWVGSLWPLRLVLRREQAAISAAAVIRFARLAIAAVWLLILAGLALAAVQLGSIAALSDTEYGRILLLKLTMVTILLLIAWDNRRRLTPDLSDHRPGASRALWRAIEIEISLVCGILLATCLLGQVTPPRAIGDMDMAMDMRAPQTQDDSQPSGYSTVVTVGNRKAWISLTPAKAGRNQLDIHLMNADGTAFDAKELTIDIADRAAGVEAIRRAPTRTAPGIYRLEGNDFSLSGQWSIVGRALIDDFTLIEFDADVTVE